ncbi:hypothetical protein SAMN04488120_103146 [Fontimonas thermophila]|uniref:DUF3325 domain-containing protein n=1 Tax=Fontimonas thermophila TaxID=1076937 RepID=A0A1I2I9T3_9GAMM|nr:hypothetical protein [Fontimonas thermophila]SFF38984.1 hypothetical protein SAMN04488120_103146 [Fontimonas thermophila]
MTTTPCAAIALAISGIPLLILALRDPKRLRSLRLRTAPIPTPVRRTLAVACLAPGVALGLLGQWPALLIWLGGLTTSGWLLVQALAWLQQAGADG